LDFTNDDILEWTWNKGLQVKKFLFGSQRVIFVNLADLNYEITKIVDKEKARNVPVRLVVHAGKNKDFGRSFSTRKWHGVASTRCTTNLA
jgi:hypothetical protein